MSLRTCTLSYCDLKGVEHAIEVTADSLYEAVAQGLRVFRENDWIDEVGHGQTTADGFERLGGVGFFPDGQGRTVAYTQWKSKRCKETQEWSPEALSDDGWIDVVAAFPLVQEATVVDRYIERQDLGIPRRPAGYLRSLKAFRALGSLPRVTFAGDYLVNSSVGQAHWSGMQAAKELVSNL